MVNLNFNKFNKFQQEHKATYIGSDKEQNVNTANDEAYNNQSDTDTSVSATDREFSEEK